MASSGKVNQETSSPLFFLFVCCVFWFFGFFLVCVCIPDNIIFWKEKMYIQEQMGMSVSGRLRAGEVFWGIWVPLKHSS